MNRRGCGHQGQWLHEGRRAKLVALAISVGLHFVFLTVLLHVTSGPLEDAAQDQNAIEVVFINSAPSFPRQVMKTQTASAMRRHTVVRRRSLKLESPTKAISASDDLLDIASSTLATGLNLAIAPARIDFRRNLIERPARPLDATVPRLQVRMLDTSLGGRLQAMAQRRICGELRSALATHSESTVSIMSAMQRHDCAI